MFTFKYINEFYLLLNADDITLFQISTQTGVHHRMKLITTA